MKCQICGVREATTHIKQNFNGQVSEQHLCSRCARETDAGFSLPDVFQSLFGVFPQSLPPAQERRRCPKCGLSFAEIAQIGKVGCADCYRVFYEQLAPTIQRIHGRVSHAEVQPSPPPSTPAAETREEKIIKLKAELQEAIQAQNFERAAELRDEIHSLNEGGASQ